MATNIGHKPENHLILRSIPYTITAITVKKIVTAMNIILMTLCRINVRTPHFFIAMPQDRVNRSHELLPDMSNFTFCMNFDQHTQFSSVINFNHSIWVHNMECSVIDIK